MGKNSVSGHYIATVCDVNQNGVVMRSTNSFGDRKWHHIIMKYYYAAKKTATVTLTVDGHAEGTTTVKNFAGIHYGPGDLIVGETNITTAVYRRNFIGYIDDLKIDTPAVVVFAGLPGHADCVNESVSTLTRKYSGLDVAAADLEYPDGKALDNAVLAYCH